MLAIGNPQKRCSDHTARYQRIHQRLIALKKVVLHELLPVVPEMHKLILEEINEGALIAYSI